MTDEPRHNEARDNPARREDARSRRTVRGERRIVTVLFCDVTGSTEMAEQLDPEEWAEIMNEAFDYLTAPVHRYEGTVARLMGDAILAFFGAPIAHEDDAERAVLAGLDIVRSVRPFRERIRREYGLDFRVRVGINTGPVVVGQIGSDFKGEYTAMGDAVNLAARMEQTAVAGTVQITEHTYRLVSSRFDVYELGGIQVKGKREPVQAYRVLGRLDPIERARHGEGLHAALVGRTSEFDALKRVVVDMQNGRGQIVCLVGEAGLGKSRLIDELHAHWRATFPPGRASGRPVWGKLQGISYESRRAYGAFRRYLRQTFQIEEGDSPETTRRKVARIAQDLPPDRIAPVTRAVEILVAASAESDAPRQGEALKRDLFEATLVGWRDLATQAPAAIVFDDLQWADPASVDLLLHLLQLVDKVPILFLCAMRPYRDTPGWRVKQTAEADYADHYTEIALRPLNDADSESMVNSLLADPDLPPALRRLILRKTEGNPFFVEEVVRALIDAGAIVHDPSGVHWQAGQNVDAAGIAIPDTVQALLTARIDRLEEDARHVLQLASVIGRTFSLRVLQYIAEDPQTLDEHLATLQHAELIHEVTQSSEREYAFRHELTRDAAYASMLSRRQRDFHGQVGQAIETLFPEHLEDQADRLAHHFHEASDDDRALTYYTLAGDVAVRLYANVEAALHYAHALEIAARSTVSGEQLVHLYTRRGRALEVSGRYDDALSNYRELERVGRERGDRQLELASLLPRATIHSTYTVRFNPERGQALAGRALSLAREVKDYRAEAKALWNLMLLALFAHHDAAQAVAHGEEALAIARRHDLREELAYILHDIARAYFEAGQAEPAWSAQEEALALWRELGNLPMLADTLTSSANRHYWVGDLDTGMARAQEALRISESIGNAWGQAYSLSMIGSLYLEQGEVSQGLQAIADAIEQAEEANYRGGQVYDQAILAWVYSLLGDVERGCEMALRALAKAEEFNWPRAPVLAVLALLYLGSGDRDKAMTTIQRAREEITTGALDSYPENSLFFDLIDGELALANGEYARVLSLTDRAIASKRAMGVRPFLPNMLHLRGQSLLGQGKRDAGRAALREARAEVEALGGSTRSFFLPPVLLALSEIELQVGDRAAAQALRRQAREILEFVADHIDDEKLRASFLARPEVRRVMSD